MATKIRMWIGIRWLSFCLWLTQRMLGKHVLIGWTVTGSIEVTDASTIANNTFIGDQGSVCLRASS